MARDIRRLVTAYQRHGGCSLPHGCCQTLSSDRTVGVPAALEKCLAAAVLYLQQFLYAAKKPQQSHGRCRVPNQHSVPVDAQDVGTLQHNPCYNYPPTTVWTTHTQIGLIIRSTSRLAANHTLRLTLCVPFALLSSQNALLATHSIQPATAALLLGLLLPLGLFHLAHPQCAGLHAIYADSSRASCAGI